MKRHGLYSCEDCPQTFPRFQLLVAHRRECHPKLHVCSDCGKAYRRQDMLLEHQKRVHSDAMYVCPVPGCGKTLASQSNMRLHHRTVHLGLRPFVCRHCGEAFPTRFVMQRHVLSLHPEAAPPQQMLRKEAADKDEAAAAATAVPPASRPQRAAKRKAVAAEGTKVAIGAQPSRISRATTPRPSPKRPLGNKTAQPAPKRQQAQRGANGGQSMRSKAKECRAALEEERAKIANMNSEDVFLMALHA